MTLHPTTRRLAVAAACLLVCALYLADLTGMGIVGPDEPRYADIGRAMARTGDWITPRLWGKPWFEKPVLLYWMIAAGFKLGLGPELAPRLPVALLGLAFLAFFWYRMRALWDAATAACSTAILATSAGWLAYSHVALTDIPVAVFFSAAVLFALSAGENERHRTLAAACLGLAVLAKSLPPVILFLPVLALDYRRLRSWFRPAPLAAFLLIALPWHILCALRNGSAFPRVLFMEHQFGRFTSTDLQHGQPFWYYAPVLLLLLYPWFPLLALIPRSLRDRRARTLAVVAMAGFVFFSSAKNKLPSYPLPLLPSLCALAGIGLSRSRQAARGFAILPVALLGLLPVAAKVLPPALAHGIRSAPIPAAEAAVFLPAATLAGLLVAFGLPRQAILAAAALAAVALMAFQISVFPSIDSGVSARPRWLAGHPDCARPYERSVTYGLNYYSGRELPPCPPIADSSGRLRFRPVNGATAAASHRLDPVPTPVVR